MDVPDQNGERDVPEKPDNKDLGERGCETRWKYQQCEYGHADNIHGFAPVQLADRCPNQRANPQAQKVCGDAKRRNCLACHVELVD